MDRVRQSFQKFLMSSKKTKLELTWIRKEHRPKLEPRILLEEPDKPHLAHNRASAGESLLMFHERIVETLSIERLVALKIQ